jgi:arabinosyltransferase C
MFADQTLTGALRATEIHSEFGPNLGWYEEWFRYQALLGTGQMGSAAKRLPVLLTLALLVVAAVLLGRRLRGVADLPGTAVLTAVAAGAFGVQVDAPLRRTGRVRRPVPRRGHRARAS